MTEPQSDEAAKPCPFCGEQTTTYQSTDKTMTFVWCDDDNCKGDLELSVWNNAWAHKRIAELEAAIKCMVYDPETANKIADLTRQLSEAKEKEYQQQCALASRGGARVQFKCKCCELIDVSPIPMYEANIKSLEAQLSERDKVVEKCVIALKHHLDFCVHTSDCEFIHEEVKDCLQSAADLKRGREGHGK